MIKNRDLTFFNLTNSRLLQRMQECRDIYDDVLEKPFDFDANENINVDYEKLPYAKNKRELVDRWRKQLKLQALSSITDKQKLEDDKKEKDAKYVVKSFETIEKEVRESSLKSLNEYFDFIQKEFKNFAPSLRLEVKRAVNKLKRARAPRIQHVHVR